MQRSTLALGFDYGEKRIGLAVGNRLTGTSRALGWIQSPQHEEQWSVIDASIQQWAPDVLLVGIPLNEAGQTQTMTRKARHFSHQLRQRYSLPVMEVDERYSSREAETELVRARGSGGKTRRLHKGDTDSLAAAILVQQWLDSP